MVLVSRAVREQSLWDVRRVHQKNGPERNVLSGP